MKRTVTDGVLRLRPFTVRDVNPSYLAWFRDPAVKRFILHPPQTAREARRTVFSWSLNPNVRFLAVCLVPSGLKIGTAKLEFSQNVATVGLLIGSRKWRGRGLGQRILRLACRYAFGLGCTMVQAGIDRQNSASIGTFRRAGFSVTYDWAKGKYWAIWRRP